MVSAFLPSILASTSYLSPILVYSIGWIVPGIVFAFLFLYVESEDIA